MSDQERLVVLLKCASPCDTTDASSWSYVATLFNKTDGTSRGYDLGYTATALFQDTNGEVHISATPASSSPRADFYNGCEIYQFIDIDSGVLRKSSPLKIVSGASGVFSGACSYNKAAGKAGIVYSEMHTNTLDIFRTFLSGTEL